MKSKILKNLSLEDYFTIKNLFHACSSDLTVRLVLSKVFYHAKKKQLVACDGHILRVHPFDFGNKDFLISDYNFNLSQAAFKKKYGKQGKADIKIDTSADHEILPYPEYEKCVPDDTAPVIEAGIDLFVLDQLKRSLPPGHPTRIKFIYHGALRAVKVYQISHIDGDDVKFLGIVMPLRCEETPGNDKLEREHEELKSLRQYKLEVESKKNVEESQQGEKSEA